MRLGPVRFLETERIADDPTLGPLLLRHIIVKSPWGSLCIHQFLRSDYARAHHDHPWAFVSFLLRGRYLELVPGTGGIEKLMERRAPSIAYRPETWRHRVVVPDGERPWSLILMGPRVRRWGFWVPDDSVPGRSRWCWWRWHDPERNICADEVLHEGGDD